MSESKPEILRPPAQLFEHTFHDEVGQTLAAQSNVTFIAEKIDASEPYGIYIYYKDLLYPSEGWPFPEALFAVNRVKRTTLLLVMSLARKEFIIPAFGLLFISWKRKIALLENFLEQYGRSADLDMVSYFLQPNRYCTCCRELRPLIKNFLMNLGISEFNSERTSKCAIMMFEFDNAYRYRLQDVMSETTKEKLLANPRKELARIMQLFVERDNPVVGKKFITFIKVLSFAMLHPKIKKAFVQAVESVDITKLQYSEADKYHCLIRDNYNYFGKTYKEREQEWYDIHNGKIPGQISYES